MRILLLLTLFSIKVISVVGQDITEKKSWLHSPEEFYLGIKSADVPLIIDARTWKEYRKERIHGAILTESSTSLKSVVDSLDMEQAIFVYCGGNQRSTAACSFLRDWGYTNVTELAGGITAWIMAGYEIDTEKIKKMDL
jgi:rhodanese-related sulfurtransferase